MGILGITTETLGITTEFIGSSHWLSLDMKKSLRDSLFD